MLEHYRQSFRAAPLSTVAGLACFLPVLSFVVWIATLTAAIELNSLSPDFAGAELLALAAGAAWAPFGMLPGSIGWKLLGLVICSGLGVKFLLDADGRIAVDLPKFQVAVLPKQAIRPKKPRQQKLLEAPANPKE